LVGTNRVRPVLTAAIAIAAQLLGVDIPLVGEERLDRHIAAIAVRHHVGVRLDLVEQPLRFEHLDDALARLGAVETVQRDGLGEIG
jgi:hypothetical protein